MCGCPHQIAVIVQSAADFTTFRCQQAVNRERDLQRERERLREDECETVGGVGREREYARDNNLVFITLLFNRWAGTLIDLYLNSSINFIFRTISSSLIMYLSSTAF